jgi:foldase protein PrsA
VSKALRFISALGAVFFAVVGLVACGGGVPCNAVAQVQETPISTEAFKHWMTIAATSQGAGGKPVLPEPPNYTACIAHSKELAAKESKTAPPSEATLKKQCETQYKSLKQEVLSFLLSSQWVIGEAKELGVKLSDAEVKSQFEKIKSQQFPKAASFEKFLALSGQSVSDLLLRVKLNLLSSKIQQKVAQKKATVTNAQIEKYYNENKARFGTPERRNVNLILTKTEAAAKSAKQEVESGKSFSSVAKKASIDPTSKVNGGKLSEVVKGQEEKTLDQAIFAAKVKALSGPIKSPFGYYVYEVTGVSPGSSQSLAQSRAAIKAQLTATQSQEALSKFVKEFKKTWTARTDCRSEYVVADCKQFKAPKTGTGTTTTG